MKRQSIRSAMITAGVLAAFTFTAAPAPAFARIHHSGAGYERCDGKESAMHPHREYRGWKKTLTPEQRLEVDKLHSELEKELSPLRARIGEKRAEIRKIAASDNPDITSLRRLVDEIGTLEKEAMLSRYESMIKVRSLLTPEQKAAFDKAVARHKDSVRHGR